MAAPIHNVLVIGGSGGVGAPIVNALLNAGFSVSTLTRETSNASFSPAVKILKTDYSATSLAQAFQGQDAIVNAMNASAAYLQETIIAAAIDAGVTVFLPSEFGVDTANPNASEVLPFLAAKIQTLEYLKSVEDKIQWTSIVTGGLFDWAFDYMDSFAGWNIPERSVTLYDGGNVPFEATNLEQAAKAVVAVLKHPEAARNQHVYVNSFTTTQNKVLDAFERVTGTKFTVKHESVDKLWNEAAVKVKAGGSEVGSARIDMIVAAFYGRGGLTNYSMDRGLSNEKLGLQQEDLQQVVDEIVKRHNW